MVARQGVELVGVQAGEEEAGAPLGGRVEDGVDLRRRLAGAIDRLFQADPLGAAEIEEEFVLGRHAASPVRKALPTL